MKKLLKFLLWSILGLFLLVVAALVASPLWLGSAVKTVATSIVPGMTDCELELKGCSINPYTGKLRLEGLNFKNPKGYDEPSAVSFESLDVALDVGSLATKKIHVVDITLEKPYVSYIIDKEGTNNFDRILANLQAKQGPKEKKPKDEKADDKDAPKVLIDRLAINGTKVTVKMFALQPAVTLPIPVPTLTKIGYGKDDEKKQEEAQGATWDEACDAVWGTIKDKFANVGGMVGNAASAVTGAVGDVAGKAATVATDALKGAAEAVKIDKAADAAKDALKGAAEAVKIDKAADAAKDALKGAADAVKVDKAAEAAKDAAAKAAEATTGAVKDGAKAVGEGLKKLNPFGK